MIEAAATLSAAVGRWEDFAVIAAMLLINAGVGFFEEKNAGEAIAALKQQLALTAHVRRDGAWQDVPARALVPGDVILVKLGNIVPADAAAAKGDYLSIDQSALTGESLPAGKKEGDTLYSDSIVRQGEMIARVTATGMNTYFGKTAKLIETVKSRSHFQRAVLRIGNFLIVMTLSLVALILMAAAATLDAPHSLRRVGVFNMQGDPGLYTRKILQMDSRTYMSSFCENESLETPGSPSPRIADAMLGRG